MNRNQMVTRARRPSSKRRSAEPAADPLTGLPLLTSVHDRVRQELARQGEIGFIFFDVVQFHQLQAANGTEACEGLLKLMGDCFNQLRGRLFRDEDLVAVE